MDRLAVDSILKLYPDHFRPRAFYPPPGGPGFSGAVVLCVETDVGPHCLRGWPPDVDTDRIAGLHRLLEHVRARGIDFVAVPVGASDGRTLVSALGHRWQWEPWLPGRADFWERSSDARLTAAMTSLAHLHLAMASFEPIGAEVPWFGTHLGAIPAAVSERIDRVEGWTGNALESLWIKIERSPEEVPGFTAAARSIVAGFHRSAKRMTVELRTAQRLRVPVQPCLRDVWHDHVLFVDDAVLGIVDPAAARTDTVAADISRLVGSLVGDDPRGWAVALAAYQTVRRLSADELTLVGVLDRSGTLLSGMTWLARRYLTNTTFAHPDRVVARVQRIAQRLEHLAES
ncbi:MAG TPA: phosphotransferase [Planctomycetaceae bacterium]|nr:phosphotransferase [Planctomycetaceae bacterium]